MSLPTTVFIVANAKRDTYIGYTKTLDVTMAMIAEGSYDEPIVARRGMRHLVFKEEFATIRLALVKVEELEAMTAAQRRAFVEQYNPDWIPVGPTDRFPPRALPGRSHSGLPDGRRTVYIVANAERAMRMNVTSDLLGALIQIRAAWTSEPKWTLRIDRLVYYEAFADPQEAVKRLRQLRRLSQKRLRELVASRNPEWNDIGPKRLMAPAGGAPFAPTTAPERLSYLQPFDDPGPESAGGGVTADLPRGPRRPVGVRTGRYEEPWPPVEEE